MKDEGSPPGPQGKGPPAGMKVKRRGSRSHPVKWAGRRTAEGPPGIGLPGGVSSTYTSEPDP